MLLDLYPLFSRITPVAREVQDSRVFRSHGHAKAEGVFVLARAGRARVVTFGGSRVAGIQARVSSGTAAGRADSHALIHGSARQASAGRVRVVASAQHTQGGAAARLMTGFARAGAGASAQAQGAAAYLRTGRVQVEIGPDLIEEELEEIMLLLEVA